MARAQYKQRLKAWKTRGFLKTNKPLTPRQRDELHAMSSLELAAAARNGSHSETGRAAAEERLKQIGGKLEEADLVVPGFVKPAPPEKLMKRFFGWTRQVRVWSGWLILLWVIISFAAIAYASEQEADALLQARDAGLITNEEFFSSARDLTDEEYEQAYKDYPMEISAFKSQNNLRDVLLQRAKPTEAGRKMAQAESIGQIAVSLLILTTLIWFVFSIFRTQPARLLLLRKFNDKKISKSMTRLMSQELRPFGHMVTLSDKHIKRSRWAVIGNIIPSNFAHAALIIFWLPIRLTLRQFNRAKYGPVWVGSARNFRSLAKRLRDRLALNLEISLTSQKEAFIIRTHDNWWKEVVKLIMNSSDVIIADLSYVTSGTEWELERLNSTGKWRKTVFTCFEENEMHALKAIDEYPWTHEVLMFTYDKFGEFEPGERQIFRNKVIDIIGKSAEYCKNLPAE